MKFHQIMTFALSALIISFCVGGAVYLVVKTGQEPPLVAEYRGDVLFLNFVGEEYLLDLSLPERMAQTLQYGWFFLPPGFRLMMQGGTVLFQSI